MVRKQEIAFGVALVAIAVNFMYLAGEEIDPSFLNGAAAVIGLVGFYIALAAGWPSLR